MGTLITLPNIGDIEFNEVKTKIGHTGKYFVDIDYKYFMKVPIRFFEHDILKREVLILQLLDKNNFDWCPKLVHWDDNKLVTSYCGKPLTSKNIPKDYKSQMNKILNDLESLNIQHNDIWHKSKPKELLVKDGKIYLEISL